MTLDLAKRSRLVTLYENHDLHFERGRFKILKSKQSMRASFAVN